MTLNRSLLQFIKSSIYAAKKYNRSQATAPRVILWPDSERQWISVVDRLRKEIDAFITLGAYNPDQLEGPAIWIKCLVDQTLPFATWSKETIPVIYMPGIAKADFKNIEEAPESIQPLMEYQFSGNLWTQENGKEWTVLSFLQNSEQGMGLEVARDEATKEALIKSLPNYFEDGEVIYRKKVDADLLNQLMFPQVIPTLLDWMERGDQALTKFPLDQQESFRDVIKSQYQLNLDYSLVLDFVKNMGIQKTPWHQVWQYFANAPHKFPNILDLLRDAKPEDMGTGMFLVPDSSWPQVNEDREDQLKKGIHKLKKLDSEEALSKLKELQSEHKDRLSWIWAELGHSPLAEALPHLVALAERSLQTYDNTSIGSITKYYIDEGVKLDSSVRKVYLIEHTKDYLDTIQVVIDKFYRPWLDKLTNQFQSLVKDDYDVFYPNETEDYNSNFILFVDAFRYDIAQDFLNQLSTAKYDASIDVKWSALPSLTPTSKPVLAPIQDKLSKSSEWNSFQVQMVNGKILSHHYFKASLEENGIHYIDSPSQIEDPAERYWMEIGDIDKKGHQDQEGMFRRIPELMKELEETIQTIFDKGVTSIQIVTDHGWLLLPGGLPKESLHRDLAETRWGRCALIKDGVSTNLLYLPWTWNPHTFIAFAPGISFFKKNEAYAHGGVSLHECLTPMISIKAKGQETSETGSIGAMEWRGMRLYIHTSGAKDGYKVDVRTKVSDAKTSIILSVSMKEDNQWSVVINGDYEDHAATLVLINEQGIIVDKKPIHIGS